MNLVKLHVAIRKGSNKAVEAKVDLPAIRIGRIGEERTVVPISLITDMELSTLVQGAAEVLETDVGHLPHYILYLNEKVIDFKKIANKMPPANFTQSLAKRKLCNDKLRRLAQASSKAVQADQQMVKGFKRKFCEHDISYASYKKHKSEIVSLGNTRLASQRDPPTYTLDNACPGAGQKKGFL